MVCKCEGISLVSDASISERKGKGSRGERKEGWGEAKFVFILGL